MSRLIKKNPLMSLWLSGANRVAGQARGLMTVAARRQQQAMLREAEKMSMAFWSGALTPLSPPKRRKFRT